MSNGSGPPGKGQIHEMGLEPTREPTKSPREWRQLCFEKSKPGFLSDRSRLARRDASRIATHVATLPRVASTTAKQKSFKHTHSSMMYHLRFANAGAYARGTAMMYAKCLREPTPPT